MREEMIRELKAIVVPSLRKLGFKGTMPHFRRVHPDGHVDLLSFQFNRHGGCFVVELSYTNGDRDNVYISKELPVEKLRVSQTNKRHRLGAADEESDHWFKFESSSFPGVYDAPAALAATVVKLLQTHGIEWWAGKRAAIES